MKKLFHTCLTILLMASQMLFLACHQEQLDDYVTSPNLSSPVTRTLTDDDSFFKVAYIEVNDTNPLNVGSYYLDTIPERPFFEGCIVFAANIHADDVEPTLYLNENVNALLSDTDKYIRPLQTKGIKVLLCIMGDHQGVGLGNLSEANQEKFAEILAWTIEKYKLDGIDLDDEWSDYGDNSNFPSSVSGSFSGLVLKLRDKLDTRFPNEHKMITVLDYGYANTLTTEAIAAIDYGWYRFFGANIYVTPSSPWTNAKYSAQALNLNQTYNALYQNQIKYNSAKSVAQGMGALMTYDMRIASQRNPLPALKKIAEGAYGCSVTYDGNAYPKDWSAGGSQTITISDIF